MTKNDVKPSQQLELLTTKIQQQLAPDAKVTHNAKIKGRHSKRSRQIDVLVEQKLGQYDIRIVLECKDYKRPVDVKGIEEFDGLLKDVEAHRGALVSPSGFSTAAKERAKGLNIDLYSPIDSDPHKWQVKASIPAICDFRSAAIAFSISCSAPFPFVLPGDFVKELQVMDDNGDVLGTPWDCAIQKWNDGGFPIDVGVHENLSIFDTTTTKADNGYGTPVEITLTASILVKQTLYSGELPISTISGFVDIQKDMIITNGFKTGSITPKEVVEKWRLIQSHEDINKEAYVEFVGLVGHEA